MIYIPYPRVKCLKTIPFTAAHTHMAQIWQYPPLGPDTTFDSLKRVHLNPKSASATSRNPLQSCLVFHLILDLLQKTCFWANFDSSYDIMLSYLVKNSIQRNKNRRGEKRVSAGVGEIPFVYQNNKRNESITLASKFLACVASVSNRVIARKLERKQKKGWIFFALAPAF